MQKNLSCWPRLVGFKQRKTTFQHQMGFSLAPLCSNSDQSSASCWPRLGKMVFFMVSQAKYYARTYLSNTGRSIPKPIWQVYQNASKPYQREVGSKQRKTTFQHQMGFSFAPLCSNCDQSSREGEENRETPSAIFTGSLDPPRDFGKKHQVPHPLYFQPMCKLDVTLLYLILPSLAQLNLTQHNLT